ncbi:MAG: hypothetical protein IPP72_16245 [Chitinophagaceae bacterium]|nr:hypothetical protein [Chitinophagaceae bacterium]
MAKSNIVKKPDASRIIRHLNHNASPIQAKGVSFLQDAINYLKKNAEYYHLYKDEIKKMSFPLEGKYTNEKSSFRFETRKKIMGSVTMVFVQTYFGLPVWESAISVYFDKKKKRILSSISSAYDNIEVLPITKKLLNAKIEGSDIHKLFKTGRKKKDIKIQSTRLLIYKFEANNRTILPITSKKKTGSDLLTGAEFVLPLNAVPNSIREGNFYIVKEIIFEYPLPSGQILLWRAFIEPGTATILYLRAFADNAWVFERDPITKGTGFAPSETNLSALDNIRDLVVLGNLDPPAFGVQSLTGTFVTVQDFEFPSIPPPVTSAGYPYDFDYNPRTNEFAAVNAYYHCNNFFQMVLDMGFGMAYFGGTVFPIRCDHRGMGNIPGTNNGNTINAQCLGTFSGSLGLPGIDTVSFALADLSNTSNPLGIAIDQRMVLHELAGHGILYCHVGGATLGFSHSAGDSFAVILNDSGTLAPDRFDTFPFINLNSSVNPKRRHDRSPAANWGWSGSLATGGYNSEQILSTTLFRLYRSIGGDSTDINSQKFAARFSVYLILKAIGLLTPSSNPSTALEFEIAMENADATDWISQNPLETHAGGAYMKVIRWAF